MITPIITEEQAKLIEDALARFAVSCPEKNQECADAYSAIINARHDSVVKKMIAENPGAGSNWFEDSQEIA